MDKAIAIAFLVVWVGVFYNLFDNNTRAMWLRNTYFIIGSIGAMILLSIVYVMLEDIMMGIVMIGGIMGLIRVYSYAV